MGFARGFLAPFRGAVFITRHGLWGHLALPILLNLGLVVGSAWLAVHLVQDRIGGRLDAQLGGSVGVVANVVLVLLAIVLSLLVFVLLQPLVGAPFVDLLSEKVERLVRGTSPSTGVWRSVGQALLHGLMKVVLYGSALLVALGLGALTGIGGLLGTALYALFLAFDGFDYPLARRGVSFGGKWRYLLVHPGQTLGYCLGASVLYLVPLALLVAPAFAAVGATLAYLDSNLDTMSTAAISEDGDHRR
jgi:CysZ protein